MKALRFHGRRDLRVEDVPEPEVREGTVKVKVDWCGLCGSDLHEYQAGPIFIPTEEHPHPVTGEHLPVVMGHEFAGTVAEVGPGVTGLSPGDPVAVEPLIYDGTCYACRTGHHNVCENVGFHGLSGGGGGLAEYTVVPGHMVHKLPEGVGTDVGALAEPIAVGWHAMRQAGFQPGQTALITGAGPIGAMILLCLRAAAARWVAISDVSEARKQLARDLGADAVYDPREVDVAEAVRQQTDGTGVDVAFECSGASPALQSAVAATAPHGTVCNVAIWEKPAELKPNDMVLSEVSMTSSLGYAYDHPAVLDALARHEIDTSRIITDRIALDDVVESGFEELINNKDQHVKILVHP